MRDHDVRTALREHLCTEHVGDDSTYIVEEMGIWAGSVRIDVAVINGELGGFELKSDSDTLARLPSQAELYSKVFDRVTLVAGGKHARKAFAMVPRWWGRIVATPAPDGGVKLKVQKPAGRNPKPDASLIVQLLWKDEAVAVLEAHGLARGWRAKRVSEIYARLVSSLTLDELQTHVRAALKARTNWLRQMRPGHLDVAVDGEAHPSSGRSSRNGCPAGGDLVDLRITPAVSKPATRRQPHDVPCMVSKLDISVQAASTFCAHAMQDEEAVSQSVLCVDRERPRHVNGQCIGSDGGVVAKVDTVRKSVEVKAAPQLELATRKRRSADLEPAEHLGHRAAGDSDGTPIGAIMKGRKRIQNRDAKGRYVSNAVPQIHDEVGFRGAAKPGPKPRRRAGQLGQPDAQRHATAVD